MTAPNGYCTFLQLGRYGRFANQIFQIAGTIGIARKNGLEPVFPRWINFDHIGRNTGEDCEVWAHFVNLLPELPVKDWHPISVPWGYHPINLLPGNYTLHGHMQSFKYFNHCIDEVRHYMKMHNETPLINKVAIHVRRGDYDNKYHPRIGMEYYKKAVEFFPHHTEFIVFTDDPYNVSEEFQNCFMEPGHNPVGIVTKSGKDWIQYENGLGKKFQFSVGNSYLDDFKAMKACKGFIIGNSSYSAAAAMLSDAPDKKVIAPSNWFGPAYASISGKDIYCDDWIII